MTTRFLTVPVWAAVVARSETGHSYLPLFIEKVRENDEARKRKNEPTNRRTIFAHSLICHLLIFNFFSIHLFICSFLIF